jgi:hypothetical protein
LVLTVFFLGVLCLCALTATAAAMAVSARARLAQAASAAALAVVQHGAVRLRLEVRYVDYFCAAAAHGRVNCGGAPGTVGITVGSGAFTSTSAGEFGALPGWAAAAGCLGTVWPLGVHAPGTYRVCIGQAATGARLVLPGAATTRGIAEQWLSAAIGGSGQLRDPSVGSVTLGSGGRVTVTASAGLIPALPWLRELTVRASAWPGGGS